MRMSSVGWNIGILFRIYQIPWQREFLGLAQGEPEGHLRGREPFHLGTYVTEHVFRYNYRATKDNPLADADRFVLAVSQISGKRLTYAELTGKVEGTGAGPF